MYISLKCKGTPTLSGRVSSSQRVRYVHIGNQFTRTADEREKWQACRSLLPEEESEGLKQGLKQRLKREGVADVSPVLPWLPWQLQPLAVNGETSGSCLWGSEWASYIARVRSPVDGGC